MENIPKLGDHLKQLDDIFRFIFKQVITGVIMFDQIVGTALTFCKIWTQINRIETPWTDKKKVKWKFTTYPFHETSERSIELVNSLSN